MPVTLEEAATVYGLKDRDMLKLADPNKRVDHAIIELMMKYPKAFTDHRTTTRAEYEAASRNQSALKYRIDNEVRDSTAFEAIKARHAAAAARKGAGK